MEEGRNMRAVEEILDSEDKGITLASNSAEGGGVLTRLFRKFLLTEGVSRMRWRTYMDQYVRLVMSTLTQEQKRGNLSVKGNTTKALCADKMTWKTFIRAMRFLQTRRLVIIIERTDYCNRTTVVKEEIVFKEPPTLSPEELEGNEK